MDKDIIVVDRSLTPKKGSMVIASVEGEMLVKKLVKRGGKIILAPENPNFREIDITGRNDFEIFGVVTSSTTIFVRHL